MSFNPLIPTMRPNLDALETASRLMLQKHLQVICWLLGAAAILLSTIPLNLWTTAKNKAYEFALIIGMGLWIRVGVPRLNTLRLTKRQGNLLALIFSAGYALANFLLAKYSITHFIRIKGDFGVFLQSIWWTLNGLPLFNTMDGTSHLGVHSSFALFALVPLYRIWRSPLVLVLIQALALGSAGFLFFRIARSKLDDLSALLLLLVFLLFPAFQYGFGDFYESSLAAPLVLLSIYGALEKRWTLFIVASCLLVTIKETFPLMLVFLGLYLVLSKSWRAGIATSLAGAIVFYCAMSMIIPWFGQKYAIFPTDFEHFGPYSRFGGSLGQVAYNVVSNPGLTLSVVSEPGKLGYLLSLSAPYLLVGLAGSLVWIVALPEVAITLLSNHADNSGPLLAGGRFSMVTVAALALSSVLTLRRSGTLFGARHVLFHRTISSTFLFVTMALAPLWLNSASLTPVRGASELPTLIERIGPRTAVAVPYDVVVPFAQRAIVFNIDRNPSDVIASCSEYVVMRHNPPEAAIYSVIQAKQFRQVWSGEVFELWQSNQSPTCNPAQRR